MALGCAGALLVGCSSDENSQGPEPSKDTVTQTETHTSDDEAKSAPPNESTGEKPCSEHPTKNPFVGLQSIPVKVAESAEAGITFHLGRMENHPNACAPLSWVKLSGTNGMESAAATAGANRETVALFVDGKLVAEPAPILALRIADVEQVDDSTIRVHYEFFSEAPAAVNKTEPGSATFHWNGSHVEISENSLPVSQNDKAETLDLTTVENRT